jgi:tetratricopeptide (TPR) repeat protein
VLDGSYSAATRLLESATKAYPSNPDAWYYLGLAYHNAGEFKKAIKTFETLINLLPDSANAHAMYARSLVGDGRLAEATFEASRALSIDPRQTDASYILGVLYLKRGLLDDVLKHSDAASKSNPEFAEPHLLKVLALLTFADNESFFKPGSDKTKPFERYRLAAESLRTYLELKPDNDNATLWKNQIESLNFYLNGDYTEIRSTREASTRVEIISKREPAYTEEARNFRISGRVTLKAVFASDGTMKHVLILQALPCGLTEQALKSAHEIQFKPATMNGKHISVWTQLEYNFNLF